MNKKSKKSGSVYRVYAYVIDGVPRYIGCGKNWRIENLISQTRFYLKGKTPIHNFFAIKHLSKILSKPIDFDFTLRRINEKFSLRLNNGFIKRQENEENTFNELKKDRKKIENSGIEVGKFGKGSYLYRNISGRIKIYVLKTFSEKDYLKAKEEEKKFINKFRNLVYNINGKFKDEN